MFNYPRGLGMRNVSVAICVSIVLAGCGGGGGSSTPSTPAIASTSVTAPTKNPLRIVTGANYDAGENGVNPRWVVADFNKDGNTDIFLRYDPIGAFSTTKTATSPVRFFLQNSNGGFEQSSSIFPEGLSLTLVNRIIASDFNGDGSTDILIAASGQDPYVNDKPAGTGYTGEYVQILTYTPNGYKLSKINNSPLTFAHHASSGDINGDYLKDAVVTSMMYADNFFVLGDSNGSYKADTTRFPKNTFAWKNVEYFANGKVKRMLASRYTSSAMMDVNNDGRTDVVFLSGAGTKTSVAYLNDGSGYFSNDRIMELPVGPYGSGSYYYENETNTKLYSNGTINLDSVVADINNDGKLDLISLSTFTNDSPNEFVYYRGAALQFLISKDNSLVDESKTRTNFNYEPSKNNTSYDTIEYIDVNNDGYKDILLHRMQVNNYDTAAPTKILLNDGKGYFTEKSYPKSLPVGILTVIGSGHYAILVSTWDGVKYTQRIDDVYYDWSQGQNLFN